jgi:ribose 5-phosphate isomerase B
MKIFIGSDHAGYELKEKLKPFLMELGHFVEDVGPAQFDAQDDYPDFVKKVAESVAREGDAKGIVIGKSGQGEAMCANRERGIRAAVYYGKNIEIVKLSREHNDANVLSLAASFISSDEAMDAVKLWLSTEFSEEERHIRRIAKLD